MKHRKGLWLSLIVVVFTIGLILFAYNTSYTAAKANPDPGYSIKFEDNCLDCHVVGLPGPSWYCHSVLPSENYQTRMYLGDHIDWITSHETIPQGMIAPVPGDMTEENVQVHVFDRRILQTFSNISVGTMVTWTNLDIRDHTMLPSAIAGRWPYESITLKPGESWSYVFQAPGVFNYAFEFIEFRPSPDHVFGTVGGKVTVLEPK